MTRFTTISLCLLLLLAPTVRAEWPFDAVCEVSNIQGGQGNGGSGTYVGASGSDGAVLTCAHMFDGGVFSVSCKFPANGIRRRAEVLGIDWANDLAMLRIQRPEDIKPVKIARVDPAAGPFTAVGYPGYAQGRLCFMTGKLVRNTQGRANTSTEFHSGYSGGCLFDRRGRLVGVTVGNDGIPGRYDYVFNYSRSISNDALINFASRWVKVSE